MPLFPETIAPAWPIFLPGGAVTPAIYDTTGFVTFCLIKSAASSSAVPPISPIITIPSVSLSAWNFSITSMNDIPGTGSPPIPIHVDCPILRFVNS